MPTENRSSNTEMLCVPRQLLERVTGTKNKSYDIEDAMLAGSQLRTLLAQPAPPHHAEPIAWMVGTAFWWTKEEAERDAAATGLPIVGLGPMSGLAPNQHQCEPVAWMDPRSPQMHATISNDVKQHNLKFGGAPASAVNGYTIPLYTHADPGEVKRLRGELEQALTQAAYHKAERDTQTAKLNGLRAKLNERDALLRDCYTELLAIKSEIGFRGATLQLIGRIDHQLSAAGTEQESKS